MKKFLLSLAGLVAFSATSSFGATVQFNTSASQLCFGAMGCGAQSQNINDILTVTFVPTVSGLLSPSPLASSTFGEIHLQCNDGSTTCAPQSLNGLQLYLVFTQLLPEAGIGQINTSTITGSIGGNSGFATLNWTVPSTTITNTFSITYTVANSPLNLVSPSNSNTLPTSTLGPPGITTIQGIVQDNAVPEPSTYAMLGTALLGLGYLRRRK